MFGTLFSWVPVRCQTWRRLRLRFFSPKILLEIFVDYQNYRIASITQTPWGGSTAPNKLLGKVMQSNESRLHCHWITFASDASSRLLDAASGQRHKRVRPVLIFFRWWVISIHLNLGCNVIHSAVIRFRSLRVVCRGRPGRTVWAWPGRARVVCNAIIIICHRSCFHERLSFVNISSLSVGVIPIFYHCLVCD